MFGLQLWAINPDGSTLWVKPPSGEIILNNMGLSPDGEVIVLSGTNDLGQPGWVRGYAAADGSFLWQVDLPPERGLNPFASAFEPAFSADSSTAYVTTQFPGDGLGYGYVYAITIGDQEEIPGDLDGDGSVGFGDLLILLASWGDCPPPPAECAADLDASGDVGFGDLLILLANWS
jgi:hypothetical protein